MELAQFLNYVKNHTCVMESSRQGEGAGAHTEVEDVDKPHGGGVVRPWSGPIPGHPAFS